MKKSAHVKILTSLIICLTAFLLSSCVVYSVTSTAVGATTTAVKTTGKAVKVTSNVAVGASKAVVPDGDKKED